MLRLNRRVSKAGLTKGRHALRLPGYVVHQGGWQARLLLLNPTGARSGSLQWLQAVARPHRLACHSWVCDCIEGASMCRHDALSQSANGSQAPGLCWMTKHRDRAHGAGWSPPSVPTAAAVSERARC